MQNIKAVHAVQASLSPRPIRQLAAAIKRLEKLKSRALQRLGRNNGWAGLG